MKKPQPNPRHPMDGFLSPGERSVLHSMKRRTVAHPSRSTPPKAVRRRQRRALAIAAIAFGLAAAAPLNAAVPDSAAQLLERARAESQAGRTALAILDCERALWLAPQDAAIANQLASVRAQAGLAAPERSPLSRATHALSFDALAALASIAFLIFALLVSGARLIPASLRALSRKAAAVFGAIVVLCASGIAARWPELRRAVVTTDHPATHVAPADSSAAAFALKPGDIVRAGTIYGPFVRVFSPDGRSGWIRDSSLESIIPRDAKSVAGVAAD